MDSHQLMSCIGSSPWQTKGSLGWWRWSSSESPPAGSDLRLSRGCSPCSRPQWPSTRLWWGEHKTSARRKHWSRTTLTQAESLRCKKYPSLSDLNLITTDASGVVYIQEAFSFRALHFESSVRSPSTVLKRHWCPSRCSCALPYRTQELSCLSTFSSCDECGPLITEGSKKPWSAIFRFPQFNDFKPRPVQKTSLLILRFPRVFFSNNR